MAIRYLIDVDYTLMSMNEAKIIPIFNQTLIDELKRLGVDSIDLLTRMDPTDVRPTKALRILLIKHLQDNGIKVGKVLTSMDDMYLHSGYFSNLKLGETYTLLMRPLEEATHKLTLITNYEERYRQYENHKEVEKKIKVLDFLLKHNVLSTTDSIEEAFQKKKSCIELINKMLIEHTTNKDNDPDFNYIYQIFKEFQYFPEEKKDSDVQTEKKLHKKSQLGEFYAELVMSYKNYQTPQNNSQEEQQIIDTYLLELTHYNNLRFISSLRYERTVSHHDTHSSKGKVYNQYVEQNTYQEDDVVIFIDDSHTEHNAVKDAHKPQAKHSLHTLYPPVHGAEFNAPNGHVQLDAFRREHSKHYVKLLCEEGHLALQSKNSRLAVECYKAAYVLLDDLGQDVIISKEQLLNKIKQAYDANNEQVPFAEKENFIARCTSAFNNGRTEIKLRTLEREQAIHEIRHPNVYRKGFTLSSFIDNAPKEIDRDFKNRILGFIMEITAKDASPEARIACTKFLSSLQTRLKYSVYQHAVTETLASMVTPRTELS